MIIGRKRTSIIFECPWYGAHENMIAVKTRTDVDTSLFPAILKTEMQCVSCGFPPDGFSGAECEKAYNEGVDI